MASVTVLLYMYTYCHGGALSGSKQSNGPNVLDPLKFIVAIEETLLCVEETDIVGSAAFPDSHWHVRPIAMAKHSLQTIVGGGGGGVEHTVKRGLN